jgi:hypothetical protein
MIDVGEIKLEAVFHREKSQCRVDLSTQGSIIDVHRLNNIGLQKLDLHIIPG